MRRRRAFETAFTFILPPRLKQVKVGGTVAKRIPHYTQPRWVDPQEDHFQVRVISTSRSSTFSSLSKSTPSLHSRILLRVVFSSFLTFSAHLRIPTYLIDWLLCASALDHPRDASSQRKTLDESIRENDTAWPQAIRPSAGGRPVPGAQTPAIPVAQVIRGRPHNPSANLARQPLDLRRRELLRGA